MTLFGTGRHRQSTAALAAALLVLALLNLAGLDRASAGDPTWPSATSGATRSRRRRCRRGTRPLAGGREAGSR